jgi:HSP20 family protein
MNHLQTHERGPAQAAPAQNGDRNPWAPKIDIHETKDAYVLRAEMPGVRKDGLEITVEGTTLTLVGRRAEQQFPGTALHRESQAADFRRVFELDPIIDTARIRAGVEQGVVTIELPKAERVKPRKIKITD